MDILFFAGSAALGAGLAMDAFSVSVANAVSEPSMHRKKALSIAGTFAFFQFLMPLAGWACVHTILEYFRVFEHLIPWIALALLSWIGIKMLMEGRNAGKEEKTGGTLSGRELLVQGIATSIDALSVGFAIAEYELHEALICAVIVAAVTFALCCAGLVLGRMIGERAGEKAGTAGGIILIAIGISIIIRRFVQI